MCASLKNKPAGEYQTIFYRQQKEINNMEQTHLFQYHRVKKERTITWKEKRGQSFDDQSRRVSIGHVRHFHLHYEEIPPRLPLQYIRNYYGNVPPLGLTGINFSPAPLDSTVWGWWWSILAAARKSVFIALSFDFMAAGGAACYTPVYQSAAHRRIPS